MKSALLEFIYPKEEGCVNCGEDTVYSICYRCKDSIKRDEGIESYGYHGGALAKIIRKFKLLKDFNCGRVLGEFLIEKIKEEKLYGYTLTYVPMSRASFKKRGFNQSEFLCERISLELDMDIKKSLKKIRKTKEQKSCTARERKVNVKNAFKALNNNVYGEKFLIIDDVMTTGSTLSECKNTLIKAGAKDVKVLTVSRSHI